MNLPDRLVRKVMGIDHLSIDERMQLLVDMDATKIVLNRQQKQLTEMKARHTKEIADLVSKWENCKHTFCETSPDPSGGTDRTVTCLLCGEIIM